MEIINNINDLTLNDEYIDVPFSGSIEESFNLIQMILEQNKKSDLKLAILDNISHVIDLLAGIGNTQESIVFDTAQLYILSKHSNINLNKAVRYFDEYSINGAKILSETRTEFDKKINMIFANNEYPYLGKIKMADLIYELMKIRNDINYKNHKAYDDAKQIILKFENKTQKDLLNALKALIV